MSVAGIDFSVSAIDLVLLADEGRHVDHHRFAIADRRGPFFAARGVAEVFPGPASAFWDEVWLLGIEDPFSPSGRTTKALGMITGAIAAQLPPGLPVVQTPPNEWQHIFCETSSLPRRSAERKPIIARHFRAWQGPDRHGWSQDAIEAAAIAWAVRDLNERGIAAAEAAG